MQLGSFQLPTGPAYGVVRGDNWLDLARAAQVANIAEVPPTLADLLGLGPQWRELVESLIGRVAADTGRFESALHALGESTFLPPIWSRPRLFTQRGNSALFSRQIRLPVPEQPVFELRHSHNLVGHQNIHVIPRENTGERAGGWNPELVAVIGTGGRNIEPEDVLDHIAGYTLMIDHSMSFPSFKTHWHVAAEDKTMRDQFFENCHFSNAWAPVPVGPWLATADEIGNPHDLWIQARETGTNASERERDRLIERVHTGALLFTFQEALSFLSRFVTLRPGDMMSTGSVGWDGYPYWDHYGAGAYIQAEVDKIGALTMFMQDQREGACP